MERVEIETLRDYPDEHPVTMLNLVKFRKETPDGEETGRAAYRRYSSAARHLVEERGGRVIWAGAVEHLVLHDGAMGEWDWALLVHYPSRAVFLEMITSPAYQEVNVLRQNSVERHLLLATRTLLSAPLSGEPEAPA